MRRQPGVEGSEDEEDAVMQVLRGMRWRGADA